MKEEFLHYIWKYNLYDPELLLDNGGNKIKVIHTGEYNRDSGPDFFNARLVIDGTEWAGNVEIHIRSSHFDLHGHNIDPAYDNVILHAVAENDKTVFNSKGQELFTTRLLFNPELYENYLNLINNPFIIACHDHIGNTDRFLLHSWISALVIERLQEKSALIMNILSETGNDWEETFYILLSRYFGFRVNREPFEMLARAIPLRIIRKHADNRFQIEALLFGTAGMLDEGLFGVAVNDDYFIMMKREYNILSAKYSLKPLHGWLWKFARLHPANFPTVRLSQLAAMLSYTNGLFSKIQEINNIIQLKILFKVSASEYWDNHYSFGKKGRVFTKSTGPQSTDLLLINAVIPAIFVYGKIRDNAGQCEKALSFLEEIDPEDNSIIKEWKYAGIDAGTSFLTQGLIQLRNNYCKKRRCLDCRIGAGLIGKGRELKNRENLMLEP